MGRESSELTVTKPDGTEMSEQEAQEFVRKLQLGVFYVPQAREDS